MKKIKQFKNKLIKEGAGPIALTLAFLLLIGMSYGLTALIVSIICWAWGIAFTFKIAFGAWLAVFLIQVK